MTMSDMIADRISRRAYDLYQQRGCLPGHEDEDWFQAEQEIVKGLAESSKVQNHGSPEPAVPDALDLNGLDGRELTGHSMATPQRRRRAG